MRAKAFMGYVNIAVALLVATAFVSDVLIQNADRLKLITFGLLSEVLP